MIELTFEMLNAYADAASSAQGAPVEASASGLRAVLALVERDQAGPCQVELHMLVNGPTTVCELRHGHHGDHVSGFTRWRERAEQGRTPACEAVNPVTHSVCELPPHPAGTEHNGPDPVNGRCTWTIPSEAREGR